MEAEVSARASSSGRKKMQVSIRTRQSALKREALNSQSGIQSGHCAPATNRTRSARTTMSRGGWAPRWPTRLRYSQPARAATAATASEKSHCHLGPRNTRTRTTGIRTKAVRTRFIQGREYTAGAGPELSVPSSRNIDKQFVYLFLTFYVHSLFFSVARKVNARRGSDETRAQRPGPRGSGREIRKPRNPSR